MSKAEMPLEIKFRFYCFSIFFFLKLYLRGWQNCLYNCYALRSLLLFVSIFHGSQTFSLLLGTFFYYFPDRFSDLLFLIWYSQFHDTSWGLFSFLSLLAFLLKLECNPICKKYTKNIFSSTQNTATDFHGISTETELSNCLKIYSRVSNEIGKQEMGEKRKNFYEFSLGKFFSHHFQLLSQLPGQLPDWNSCLNE